MRTILHIRPLYRASSWEKKNNGRRRHRTPKFLEADLAGVEILNCQFRFSVKDRLSVFSVEKMAN